MIERAVIDALVCTDCGFEWDPKSRSGDLPLNEVTRLLPTGLKDLGLHVKEEMPGQFLDPTRRALVRGYDAYEHAPIPTGEGFDLSLDRLRDPHRPRCARLQDTILYLGESEGIDGFAMWEPARIVWMSAFARDGVSRWCLTLTPPGGVSPVAVHQLPPRVAVAVDTAAESGGPLERALVRMAFAELEALAAP